MQANMAQNSNLKADFPDKIFIGNYSYIWYDGDIGCSIYTFKVLSPRSFYSLM